METIPIGSMKLPTQLKGIKNPKGIRNLIEIWVNILEYSGTNKILARI